MKVHQYKVKSLSVSSLSPTELNYVLNNQPKVSLKRLMQAEIPVPGKHKKLDKPTKPSVPRKPIKPRQRQTQQFKFRLSQHRVRRKYRCNYKFMCKVKKHTGSFKNLREWNEHHRLRHPDKTCKCMKCGKISPTPITFRDHSYFHGVKKFTCNRCTKAFINISRLNLHRHIHCRH